MKKIFIFMPVIACMMLAIVFSSTIYWLYSTIIHFSSYLGVFLLLLPLGIIVLYAYGIKKTKIQDNEVNNQNFNIVYALYCLFSILPVAVFLLYLRCLWRPINDICYPTISQTISNSFALVIYIALTMIFANYILKKR